MPDHAAPDLALPLARLSDEVLLNCMHCGLCLPHCPTYQLQPLERYSPRGRIQLARTVHEGNLTEAAHHRDLSDAMDSCLGCLACQTACPAGVEYEIIFEAAKESLAQSPARAFTLKHVLLTLSMRHVFTQPRRFKFLSRIVRVFQTLLGSPLVNFLPKSLRRLLQLSPRISKPFFGDAFVEKPNTAAKPSVMLLSGCVMNTAFADIHRDTVLVLEAAGFHVQVPRAQVCCGALGAHNGFMNEARTLARANIDAFEMDAFGSEAAVVVNSAGCGAMMKHYALLFGAGDPYHAKADAFAWRVKDFSEMISPQMFASPRQDVKITYQDACHLEHGQGITAAPRALLSAAFGQVEEIQSPECCGSAGIYNLIQPERSEALLAKKIAAIEKTGASQVVTCNPGCQLQLRYGLASAGSSATVVHLATALASALHSPE
ncbi:MAG: (Fe-S)-binding protein [Rhizobacter sp.]|nr:(Fe-S)-binding protein [Chlorobiales bacterium]